MSEISYRVACAADRMTAKRLGRERNDDTEDDEEWDLEWAQAVQDYLDGAYDAHRERMQEMERVRRA